jgi:16S rRNA (guanine527-N7)-methyltransferase
LDALDECLAVLDVESLRGAARLADVGSGAGLPGIVLAAALPDTAVTLIESDPSRSAFLGNVAERLQLSNVEVVPQPVQSWTSGFGVFDAVTARRAMRPQTIMAPIAQLLRPGGVAVVFLRRERDRQDGARAAAAASGLALEPDRAPPMSRGRHRLRKRTYHVYRRVPPDQQSA